MRDIHRSSPNACSCRASCEVRWRSASLHLGCKIEDAETFHAVRRDRILIMDDSDVPEAECLDQRLHDLVIEVCMVPSEQRNFTAQVGAGHGGAVDAEDRSGRNGELGPIDSAPTWVAKFEKGVSARDHSREVIQFPREPR